MNRATFKKRVKVKESNLQSVSYFRLWFVFFCEAMIHNVVTGSQASCSPVIKSFLKQRPTLLLLHSSND